MAALQENLKRIMKQRDLDVADIAFMSKVRNTTVYSWLNGGGIQETNLENLAKGLGVPKDMLTTGAATFDVEVLTAIMEAIDERCDNAGTVLSTRQKVRIAHTLYNYFLRDGNYADEGRLEDLIAVASA